MATKDAEVVTGYIKPIITAKKDLGAVNEFENCCLGMFIPPNYVRKCEKGFNDALLDGALVGGKVEGQVVL